jgi:hypothetical protein
MFDRAVCDKIEIRENMGANMTFPIRIVPRYRLLLRYDIRPDAMDTYYEFIMNEFIPALQSMGLYMAGVWHTAYGDYPNRQVEFIGDSREIFREVLQSERWEILENKLQIFTLHYERKLVRYRQDRFQF